MPNDQAEKSTGQSSVAKAEEFVAPHVNSRFAITVIVIFMAILILPTVAWGAIKAISLFNPSIMDAFNVDTGENRNMTEFPDSFNPQTFAAELENWYNDNLPFRAVLFNTQSEIENAFERPYRKSIMPFLIELFHPSDNNSSNQPPQDDIIIENPFETETETETEIPETETLPSFESETEETGPQVCQHVYKTESTVIQEPTCTEYGILGYECENCDHIGKKEYMHKLQHDYVSDVSDETELPQCGEKYEETMTCSVCNDSYSQIKTKKHSSGEVIKKVEATYEDYGYTLVQCPDCQCNYRTELSNKLIDTSYFPPVTHNETLSGRYNWLFYTGNNSVGFYQGTNHLEDRELQEYTTVLQELNDICKKKGIKFAVGFWPNKELIYSEYMPTYNVNPGAKRVEVLTEFIRINSDVPVAYPLEQLKKAKPYWQLYYKHDTHWNTAGGFIGVQELYRVLGFETTSLLDLPVKETARNGGDLINIGKLSPSDYTGDKNYSVTYRPDVTVKTVNNNPINSHTSHVSSNGPIDLNFVMLSDSFRGAMRYFLERDFTNCFLTHRSQVNDADVIAAIKEADVLVISAVERNDSSVISTARRIIEILSEE